MSDDPHETQKENDPKSVKMSDGSVQMPITRPSDGDQDVQLTLSPDSEGAKRTKRK